MYVEFVRRPSVIFRDWELGCFTCCFFIVMSFIQRVVKRWIWSTNFPINPIKLRSPNIWWNGRLPTNLQNKERRRDRSPLLPTTFRWTLEGLDLISNCVVNGGQGRHTVILHKGQQNFESISFSVLIQPYDTALLLPAHPVVSLDSTSLWVGASFLF